MTPKELKEFEDHITYLDEKYADDKDIEKAVYKPKERKK